MTGVQCSVCDSPIAANRRLYCSTNCVKRAWYLRNRSAAIVAAKQRYEADRPKAIIKSTRWRQLNQAKRLEITARYREGNREKASEYGRIYRKANPDLIAEAQRRRRARERQVLTHTPAEWLALKASYCGICPYCSRPADLIEADHIVALALGGTDDIENIVPACRSCNRRKSDLPLLVFLARQPV